MLSQALLQRIAAQFSLGTRSREPACSCSCAESVARCPYPPFERDRNAEQQRFRMGFIPGNNVVARVTDADRRSVVRMQERIGPSLDEVDTSVDSDSRCYIR